MEISQNGPVLGDKSDGEIDATMAALADDARSHDARTFNEQELRALELYDELKEIRLHKALARAQIEKSKDASSSIDIDTAPTRLKQASKELLEARATYVLEASVVDNVLEADPVLKAVHAGSNTSSIERALHPMIDDRDRLSISQANLSASLQSAMNDITMLQADNIKAIVRNRELTSTLWELASQLKVQDIEAIDDLELRERLETVRSESKESRRHYRILKSVASGVIAGSGVDWAEDDGLRDIVLDAED